MAVSHHWNIALYRLANKPRILSHFGASSTNHASDRDYFSTKLPLNLGLGPGSSGASVYASLEKTIDPDAARSGKH